MKADDYKISSDDACDLYGAALVPTEFRRMILAKYAAEHGNDALLNLFSEFMGLANSLVTNTREFIELFLIIECKMSDRMAEKINLPTISGALNGAKFAIEPVKGMCEGCAFRSGTPANQSPITSYDANDCADDGTRFLCHETLPPYTETEDGKRTCAGYIAARKAVLKRCS